MKHVSPSWRWHIPCCFSRRPEFVQRDTHGGHVRRFETSGLKQGALFILVLSILAVACGGGTDTGTSTDPASNDPNDPDPSHKVTVCHIPPGNPANAHTISVGAPAVPAHLAHGDYLGPCHGSDGPPGPTPSSDAGTPGPGNPGGGPGATCQPAGAACGAGCCSGLICTSGLCSPSLN